MNLPPTSIGQAQRPNRFNEVTGKQDDTKNQGWVGFSGFFRVFLVFLGFFFIMDICCFLQTLYRIQNSKLPCVISVRVRMREPGVKLSSKKKTQ